MRRWKVVACESFETYPTVRLPGPLFVLVLAADARGKSDAALRQYARWWLDRGARVVGTWGPDCQRVQKAFLTAPLSESVSSEEGFVTATAHPDESLEEAMRPYVLPALSDCLVGAGLVVAALGNNEWASRATNYLGAGAPV